MTVMIGVDPHKATHTAVAIYGCEVELAKLKVRASKRQSAQLLTWAAAFEDRAWAIESAAGLGYLLAQQLLAVGETVLDVPATLAARVRVLSTGRSDKNDPNDARSVAIVAPRGAGADRGASGGSRERVASARETQPGSRSVAEQGVLSPPRVWSRNFTPVGSPRESLWRKPPSSSRASSRKGPPRERHRMALELVEDLTHIDIQGRESRRRIAAAVTASGTTLTEIFAWSPVIAATVIGYTGDPWRFTTEHRYAAYNGTAPIEFSSAGRKTHHRGAGTAP